MTTAMDVIVECHGLNPFRLRVGRFDTVGKIKEKIEALEGIPIAKQILCFNNEILPDDYNVRDFGIVDGSTLLLIQGTNARFNQPLPAEDEDRYFLDDEDLDFLLSPHFYESRSDSGDEYPMESLGRNIFEREGETPQCNYSSYNNPSSWKVWSRRPVSSRRPPSMRVVVRCKDQQASVPVYKNESVSALRRRLRQRGFSLPEPCFFIHKKRVMEEGQSFATNEVRHGDLIEPILRSGIDSAYTSGPAPSANSSSDPSPSDSSTASSSGSD